MNHEHKWAKVIENKVEWCWVCGAIRIKTKDRYQYKYPERRKSVTNRKNVSRAEKAWYEEWSN